jgi:hypothetical protein
MKIALNFFFYNLLTIAVMVAWGFIWFEIWKAVIQ